MLAGIDSSMIVTVQSREEKTLHAALVVIDVQRGVDDIVRGNRSCTFTVVKIVQI
jgi:hypothetical protein